MSFVDTYNVHAPRRVGDIPKPKECPLLLASFPGSPRERVYCVTIDPHERSGGEPGEFYHVSDVKGREDIIGRRRAYRSVLHRPRMQAGLFPVRTRSYRFTHSPCHAAHRV